MQSDSEHPIFSPLSKNSRNTVYKLRFANSWTQGWKGVARVALQGAISTHPFQITINLLPVVDYPIDQLSGPILRDTARLSQRYPPIARWCLNLANWLRALTSTLLTFTFVSNANRHQWLSSLRTQKSLWERHFCGKIHRDRSYSKATGSP